MPNIGSVFERSLPITPTSGTLYNSPHRIKGIADWFKYWTGSSRNHHQDQDGSYELENLIPWVPRVSRYPPQLPDLDLGPAFHVGGIFRRDLQTDCKSIYPLYLVITPSSRLMKFKPPTVSRRIGNDMFPMMIMGGMAVLFLVLVFTLQWKKILSCKK